MHKQRLRFSFLNIIFFTISLQATVAQQDLAKYVNPFIGTQGTGHTFPGATVPLGLIQLSPETGNANWKYCSGYQHKDVLLKGFAHTHMSGTGVADLGDVLVLPLGSNSPKDHTSIDKTKETASAGYYSVYLPEEKVKAELTASVHCGVHKYTYYGGGDAHLLINTDNNLFSRGGGPASKVKKANITIENQRYISGSLQSKNWVDRDVYFYAELSKPITAYSYTDTDKRKLLLSFKTTSGEAIELRLAISTVSIEGAKNNLKTEMAGKTFNAIQKQARTEWNKYLSLIEIEADNVSKTNFYTSMYHLFVQPNNIADVDGKYRGADNKVYQSPSKPYYSTLSNWDVYRGAFPLYSIINKELYRDVVNNMLAHTSITGYLPIWTLWGKENHCMLGNHGVPIVADAVLKGFGGIDTKAAFTAIKNSLTKNNWYKYDFTIYDKYGYLPSDTVTTEAVSRTLEATFDDWCAAKVAEKLDNKADAFFFNKRADYYKNLFDPSTNFMRGKKRDGSWVTPFDPARISAGGKNNGDYTEGNAWQYTWHVQHDVNGLMKLFGGKKPTAFRLDSLFTTGLKVHGDKDMTDVSGLIGQYAHGNEPSHHIIYLYNYVEQPHKAQKLIKEVLASQYTNAPDGLIGNDDCGQMSAWYILSSLGFYPVNPVSGMFDLGIPAYKKARVKVGQNKYFTVLIKPSSTGNSRVKSIWLNGKPLEGYMLNYKDIMSGAKLEFLLE